MTLLDDPSPKAIPCHVLMQDATGKDFIYGVPTMTQELGGLPYGDSIILAAPTQTGKTTLAYQLAEVAAFQNLKAHYVSTESTGVGLLTKRAMGNLGMSMKTLRTGMITDLQRQEAKDEINRLMGLYNGYLTFDDKSHDVDSVLRNVARAKPSLLVVDHLGELRYKGDNKTIGIEENFTEIRRYCHAEGIAFLCVHMIDIDVTTRPQLSDLRWAKGGLSEKCDIALMMYRPDLADCRDGDENTIQAAVQIRRMPVQVEIWERKDRGGPVDLLIDSVFDLHYQFFRSPAMQMQGQQIAFTV
jgi:replicative DNA helicase